jgi:acetylornithine deacetylase/succinyl-diaminopimelate desuccinylase-like protein
LLEGLGFTVERHPVSAALCARHGMISATNLIVRSRFGEGPVVALNAHGDVVPPGEGWTHDPYEAKIVDGWMYGRGVAVSKSDIATYAFALLALEEADIPLRGTVELHITYDEEAGGEIGPALLLKTGLSKPDLAIGAGFSYALVNAHNGCLHLEVEVTGRSAHAAMPFTGVDALEAATAILSGLYAWRPSLTTRTSAIKGIGSPQLTVGLIKGGINTNVVPDRVTFRLDRRMIPEERSVEVEAELRGVIAEAASAYPKARVDIRRILLAEPLVPLAGGQQLTDILCSQASRIMGETVAPTGVPLYTDARHYAEAGVPVVLYGAGPHTIEEANAHRADERLPLSDLHKATEVIALSLAELLAASI